MTKKGSSEQSAFLARVADGARQITQTAAHAKGHARAPTAVVFSDMDVDGITSHTIMRTLLERLGYRVEPVFSKKFADEHLERLSRAPEDLVVVTDHGSPERGAFEHENVIVIDHHKPPRGDEDHSHQVHPELYGLSGSTEICSAGIAYLVARAALKEGAQDLSVPAVIGSVGDMMDHKDGRFTGLTRSEILGDAVAAGLVETHVDVRLYGRHTRTLTQLLCFADDPGFQGLSKSREACQRFLIAQGVNPEAKWCDLDEPTKRRLVGLLLERASEPTRLLGEVYELAAETPGSLLRDVREYATLINGSSRYEMPETAVAVLRGDRGRPYETALSNHLDHKRNIVRAIQLIGELGVTRGGNLQWFHVEGLVRHTIVGSVAGVVQSRHDPHVPMIGFAYEAEDPGLVKVSGRGNRALVKRGLDLSRVMGEAAGAVGGKGGGHDVAAGATIPAGKEQEFLAHAERVLSAQLAPLEERPDETR